MRRAAGVVEMRWPLSLQPSAPHPTVKPVLLLNECRNQESEHLQRHRHNDIVVL
jgi:hypothetical protein